LIIASITGLRKLQIGMFDGGKVSAQGHEQYNIICQKERKGEYVQP
jgi:hypothetical protein